MKSGTKTSFPKLAVGVLWLVLCPRLFSAEPSPWLEVHSTHFTVITDAGEKKGREVALRFEQMRAVFGQLLGKDRLQQSRPLTILAFKSDKTYYQLAPLHQGQPIQAPGFFLPGDDQDFIGLNTFEEESWCAVAHDLAISLLASNYPPAQGWFDEGLAEYFSSIHVDNKQVQIGGDAELQPTIVEDLLGNQHDTQPPKSLTELLNVQVWLPLPDLFAMRHDTSKRNEGSHHILYYAESWIVMHYLLHQKKMPETGEYFNLVLNRHVAVEDAIQQAYGMSSAQLEQAVKDYFKSQVGLQMAVDQARVPSPDPTDPAHSSQTDQFPVPVGPDDSVITAEPFPEADARAIYAGVELRIPERREAGLKTLEQLATTPTEADKKAAARPATKRVGEDPDELPTNAIGNPVAHRVLGYDHIEHGEFDEAFAELRDAVALDPRDLWLRYYISLAKYRMARAKHAEMVGLANMILDLKAVLEWNPEMADAYDLLAMARSEGGSATAAQQSERAAIGLSPRDEHYVFHLAEIDVASKKWDAADSLLERLKASSNPQIAADARNLLSQAGTERKYGIAGASADAGAPPKFEPQKSPFDVLEQDAAKRASAADPNQAGPADGRATKYVKGRLVAVDCSKLPAATLTINSEAGTLQLHSADYKSLLLIGADDFSCDWRDRQVTVNYKPSGSNRGDLVSLEVR
jgi:tetratricopeptide (TPR) repeat protein